MGVNKVCLYVDGAARGNPGPAGIGVVIKDASNATIKEFCKSIGETTNNIAEYNALIYGLQEVHMLGAKEIVLNMDSELVYHQLRGEYRVRNKAIKPFFEQAIHLINGFDKFDIRHIDRKENREADRLANKAINLSGLKRNI